MKEDTNDNEKETGEGEEKVDPETGEITQAGDETEEADGEYSEEENDPADEEEGDEGFDDDEDRT